MEPQGPSKQHDAQYHRERAALENLLPVHDKCPPRCTTAQGYHWWRTGEFFYLHRVGEHYPAKAPPMPGMSGFCEDCTPEYQAAMAQAGRCDHPEILFYRGKDGLIFGSQQIFPSKKALGIAPETKGDA